MGLFLGLFRTSPGTSTATLIVRLSSLLPLLGLACGNGVDPRPASWSYLSAAVMRPNCATASCHSPAAAVAGLDFSTQERGYTSLMGLWIWIVDLNGDLNDGCKPAGTTIVCPRDHRSLVVPFNPAQSRLVHMLRAQGAPRMPPDRPLAEADIRLIEEWILAGAPRGISGVPIDMVPVDGSFRDAGDATRSDGAMTDGQPIDAEAPDAQRPDAGPTGLGDSANGSGE